MRKINVLELTSLDGVVHAGGAPEEVTNVGFAYGEWIRHVLHSRNRLA